MSEEPRIQLLGVAPMRKEYKANGRGGGIWFGPWGIILFAMPASPDMMGAIDQVALEVGKMLGRALSSDAGEPFDTTQHYRIISEEAELGYQVTDARTVDGVREILDARVLYASMKHFPAMPEGTWDNLKKAVSTMSMHPQPLTEYMNQERYRQNCKALQEMIAPSLPVEAIYEIVAELAAQSMHNIFYMPAHLAALLRNKREAEALPKTSIREVLDYIDQYPIECEQMCLAKFLALIEKGK